MELIKNIRVLIAIAVLVFVSYVLISDGVADIVNHRGASPEPVDFQLAALEGGALPAQSHLRIGGHYAAYWSAVFQYQSSSDGDEPSLSDRVDYAFYPVFSDEHPYAEEIETVEVDESGALSTALTGFKLLVRTHRFSTVGDVPDGTAWEEGVVGLLDAHRAPTPEEIAMLSEDFTGIDPASVLVLEEGRRPPTLAEAGGQVAGGVGVFAVALGLGWWRLVRPRRRQAAPPFAPPTTSAGSPSPEAEVMASKPDPLFK